MQICPEILHLMPFNLHHKHIEASVVKLYNLFFFSKNKNIYCLSPRRQLVGKIYAVKMSVKKVIDSQI